MLLPASAFAEPATPRRPCHGPTLVVDDDYRVAGIHAALVGKVPGFRCVREAHTAAEARAAIGRLHPELILLDLYLPDEHGLTLLRSLRSDTGPVADCIILTAARDLRGVRTAMHLGAVYYLVKPFGFAQLREQLEAYRRWREQIACSRQADQATVDILYQFRRMPHTPAAIAGLPPTVRRILSVVSSAATAVSAADIAQRLGMSQAAAQRCLTDLQKRALTELELEYGATGRPIHRYRLPRRRAGGIR